MLTCDVYFIVVSMQTGN